MTAAEQPGADGLALFSGHGSDMPPVATTVFGIPAEHDVLDRLGTVSQDDLGSDFFSRGTPATDDQARAAFRDSLIALVDVERPPATPTDAPSASGASVTASVPTSPPSQPSLPAQPPAPSHGHAASRLSAAEREFVLYGPSPAGHIGAGGHQ